MEDQTILAVETAGGPIACVRAQLTSSGFAVRAARDIADARSALGQHQFSLVLIRAMTHDGPVTCRRLRRHTAAPMLALCSPSLAVECLEAGADSTLADPVSFRLLEAKVIALCRAARPHEPLLPDRESYHIGELVIDTETHRARRSGRRLDLTPTEFRLLLALARRDGRVVPHGDLIDEVWGPSGTDQENLRRYVRYLREKLDASADCPQVVISHRGVGYALATDTLRTEEARLVYA